MGTLRKIVVGILYPRPPRLPRFLKTPARVVYESHFLVLSAIRTLVTVLYRHWIFQGRCASVGKNLTIGNMPFVNGPVEVHIGDDVSLGGNVFIASARFLDNPRLIIENNVHIGWNCTLTVNREVVIEEHALISYHVHISDSDGHRREADLRAQNAPVDPRDIRPVRIGRHAWIGNNSHILKGVTIGEGAIIGANSVVLTDIPAYCIALGNPAEVYFRNAGKPSRSAERAEKPNAEPAP